MTITTYLRKPNKDNECGISFKITNSKRQRTEKKTGEKINPDFWDNVKKIVKRSHPQAKAINELLEEQKEELRKTWRDTRNWQKFLQRLHGINDSLLQTYSDFLEKFDMSPNYKRRFVSLHEHIKALGDIDLSEIDLNYYDKLKFYLRTKANKNEGCTDATVYKYISNFSTFLDWAGERGHNVNPSFRKWQIIKRDPESTYLYQHELEAIEKYPFTGLLAIARDYLVINCRVGWRISDCKKFDPNKLNGRRYEYYQSKGNRTETKLTVVIFEGFCEPAYNILKKYGFQMPKMTEKDLNLLIKQVCRIAGITTPTTKEHWKGGKKLMVTKEKCDWITTHTGRKTFINLALDSGIPAKIVSQALNVSQETIKRNYMGNVEEKTIVEHLKRMTA